MAVAKQALVVEHALLDKFPNSWDLFSFGIDGFESNKEKETSEHAHMHTCIIRTSSPPPFQTKLIIFLYTGLCDKNI